MAEISLILVTYRSAAVAGRAVASYRKELAREGLAGEVVVVDHSQDPAEEGRLRALAPERLVARDNRGYAAGINAGIAAAGGEVLLLANPDVELGRGSLGALLAALGGGWDVAGPRFFLGDFLFPPADLQTPAEEVRRWLAARGPALFWKRHLLREVRRWRRVWEAAETVAVPALSGALLALPAAVAGRLGPWDEGYFLYFEESDWLRRARRAGLRLGLAPAARVRHAWGHAALPGAADAHYAVSRRRYYRRRFGAVGAAVARLPPAAAAPRPPLPAVPSLPASPDLLWLVSPSPLAFPAAGARGLRGSPQEALRRFAAERSRPGPLTVTAWDPGSGRLHGPWSWNG